MEFELPSEYVQIWQAFLLDVLDWPRERLDTFLKIQQRRLELMEDITIFLNENPGEAVSRFATPKELWISGVSIGDCMNRNTLCSEINQSINRHWDAAPYDTRVVRGNTIAILAEHNLALPNSAESERHWQLFLHEESS